MFRLAMRLLSWVPPRLAEILAPPLGLVLWYASPRRRRVTRRNLRAVYPDMPVRRRDGVARASMTHYVRGVFEAGLLWHWPLARIFACFDEPADMHLYADARRSNCGVILAAAHSGAWELLNLYMQQHLDGAVLYKPGRQPEIEKMLLEKRRRGGGNMAPATAGGLRTFYQLLRAGKTVGLAVDQEPTLGEGRFAPFFGVEALTGVLLPRMARKTGARVLFVTCERLRGGRYRVHFFEAEPAVYDPDTRTAVEAVNRGVERCIEVDRRQYLWAYKRFRNRPEGEKPFYFNRARTTARRPPAR